MFLKGGFPNVVEQVKLTRLGDMDVIDYASLDGHGKADFKLDVVVF